MILVHFVFSLFFEWPDVSAEYRTADSRQASRQADRQPADRVKVQAEQERQMSSPGGLLSSDPSANGKPLPSSCFLNNQNPEGATR